MRYVITTPVPRWTGEVAGVAFAFGRGVTDDNPPARVINYFLRRGYGVEPVQPAAAEPDAAVLDAVEDETPASAEPAQAEKKLTGRRGGTTPRETP